jgi:hypothetical protein
MNDTNGVSLLSVSTCGNAQSESLIRYASDPEQVGVVDHSTARSLPVHTKTQLGVWGVDPASTVGLFAVHIQTVDTADLGLGMAACVVLNADD